MARSWLLPAICVVFVICMLYFVEGRKSCKWNCIRTCLRRRQRGFLTPSCVEKCREMAKTCSRCSSLKGGCKMCVQGYKLLDSRRCVDIDECAAGNGGCSSDASCSNVARSVVCACKTGFVGDGKICTDIDECATGNGGCSSDASCSNVVGSFTCKCNTGYSGNGKTCEDIDECQTDVCSTYANCMNSMGSFNCTCSSGYVGNGTTCTVCPDNYEFREVGKSCYRVVLDVKMVVTHEEAYTSCSSNNAHLVWLETQEELDDIKGLVKNKDISNDYWIGLCRENPSTFVWAHECPIESGSTKSLAYTPTFNAQPGYDCVLNTENSGFQSYACDVELIAFVCEFDGQ